MQRWKNGFSQSNGTLSTGAIRSAGQAASKKGGQHEADGRGNAPHKRTDENRRRPFYGETPG